ncbi:MAG: tRNA (guanosine(46)-N7)-methyltransferase TrmB [Crocinitomicaceae bacterium]|jgi:tRNA (guanine-N7-)-methyltransferase|nr:tRNA (guanosine(46)-N7)-methyltransferase TrmB [Crocinitomicaceae bacterium]
MGKGKLAKWKELATFERVFEPTLQDAIDGKDFEFRGNWAQKVFGNDNPIVLELGCGKGEYTIAQARNNVDCNFIGVDIKGQRVWRGAKTINDEDIRNVAFLRTRIEFIDRYFAPDEISGIWLTFSDPQPKDEKGTKRITSSHFIEKRYRNILKPGSLIHVKSDSPLVYALSKESYEEANYQINYDSADVYGELIHRVPDDLKELLDVKTFYEQMWLEEGRKIHYLQIQI